MSEIRTAIDMITFQKRVANSAKDVQAGLNRRFFGVSMRPRSFGAGMGKAGETPLKVRAAHWPLWNGGIGCRGGQASKSPLSKAFGCV